MVWLGLKKLGKALPQGFWNTVALDRLVRLEEVRQH